ncbi:P27 family phage terminase small subunit [uncultured Flavobacterium sp.]|uniref:P27 family phage terminase small subunit n=1 Tax=uncultured Flavobacterium sp. TaxID=165435 RepID=UPI0025EB8B97|nr:P27 family phage terminase small subunit [uncultured Flavobacterium sp.]
MKNNVLKLEHKGEPTNKLEELPGNLPKHLSREEKTAYKKVADFLMKEKRITATNLHTLEIFAVNYVQWSWACTEINKLNKVEPGTGYIQKYSSGAKNITAEMVLRDRAAKEMKECSALFGLDPKSEKALTTKIETGQLDLWEKEMSKKHG